MLLTAAPPDHYDGLDDVFPVDDDWDMLADPNPNDDAEPQEPTVVDDEVWAGKGLVQGSMNSARMFFVMSGSCTMVLDTPAAPC